MRETEAEDKSHDHATDGHSGVQHACEEHVDRRTGLSPSQADDTADEDEAKEFPDEHDVYLDDAPEREGLQRFRSSTGASERAFGGLEVSVDVLVLDFEECSIALPRQLSRASLYELDARHGVRWGLCPPLRGILEELEVRPEAALVLIQAVLIRTLPVHGGLVQSGLVLGRWCVGRC